MTRQATVGRKKNTRRGVTLPHYFHREVDKSIPTRFKRKTVVVEVRGGVCEVVILPAHMSLIIRDFDVEKGDPDVQLDHEGSAFLERRIGDIENPIYTHPFNDWKKLRRTGGHREVPQHKRPLGVKAGWTLEEQEDFFLEASRKGEIVVDQANHREVVQGEYRYFFGWDSQLNPATEKVWGWFHYKSMAEIEYKAEQLRERIK